MYAVIIEQYVNVRQVPFENIKTIMGIAHSYRVSIKYTLQS